MSGIIGVFNLDGRPVEDGVPERMLQAIAFRGPDGRQVWRDGAIALGHCLLRTTPESLHERQPLAADGLCIAFDGRIDNREELAESFDRERVGPAADFDAAFALCAYRIWGESCAARLLGDFAFAVWDAPRRRLFCARDVLGVKPFYYHRGPNVFLFASEPQALFRHPAVSLRPNEAMVGEYLSVVTSLDDTLFTDVQRLPRAMRLVVTADDCRIERYWDIDAAKEIRYRTLDEYGEHLRSLLREAVRVRVRSATPAVGVMLSGGVDSSSVLAMAASLKREGAVAAECETFSLVAPAGVMDESAYIDLAVKKNGCRAHKFVGDAWSGAALRQGAWPRVDLPPAPNGRLACTLKETARRAGIRVLLSGVWGDEWFGGSYYDCADLFRTLRWPALVAKVRAQSRVPDVPVPGPLVKILVWSQLPLSLRKRIKMVMGRDGVPPWVRRDFARRIALADRLYPTEPGPPFPTIGQRQIYREVMNGVAARDVEEEDRTAAEFGVETRHPFGDRRIMEFGLAIPADLRWRGGVRKFVLREAMREYLPGEVRHRLTSADASPVFLAPLAELVDDGLFRAPAVERRGWVDGAAVRGAYESMVARQASGDPAYVNTVWPLWVIASVEIWMQEVVERRAAPGGVEEEPWQRTEMTRT